MLYFGGFAWIRRGVFLLALNIQIISEGCPRILPRIEVKKELVFTGNGYVKNIFLEIFWVFLAEIYYQ